MSGKKVPARLCYVDDSRTSAYVVKRMLRPYGYSVDHYESAEPALVALVQDNYDLLLTDLKVSPKGMDGDDLVRALRNSGHDKISDMPVIVITGATDSDILAQVYDAGANHILTKPVNGDELDAEIRKLVFSHNHDHVDDENEFESLEALSAKVVPFESEAKKQSFADQIPVLNSDKATNSDHQSYESTKSLINKNWQNQGKSDERRLLGPADDESGTKTHAPVSKREHTPAARVKPTVRVRTKSVKLKAKGSQVSNSNMAKSQIKASGLGQKHAGTKQSNKLAGNNISANQKVALTRTNKSAHAIAIANKARLQAAKNVANRTETEKSALLNSSLVNKAAQDARDKAEALRKVKAAIAAKKAKLAQQQRDIEKQLQGSRLHDSPEHVLSDINSEDLTLEPMDGQPQPVPVFDQTSQQPSPQAYIDVAEQQQSHAPQQQPPHTPDNNTPRVEDVLAAFQQTGSNKGDILQSMEQYPLVEADLGTNYSPSRLLRMVNSVLELYGPKRILTSVAMIGVLLVVYGAWNGIVDDGLSIEVTAVNQGEIFQSITVPGRVVSKLRVNMTPSIAGRITNVYVEEGDRVESGDLLARLDDREAKSYLTRAKANLEGSKEDVVLAERSLKRLKQAFDKGAIARQLVEDAQVELRSARARESISSEEVRTAKLSLENPRVVAPFSGTVTSRFIEVGQWVVPSETLFTLVDESQREIEVRVDAADSGGIAVGQTVAISSDAFPGLNWSESVTRLAAATNSVGNANTVSVYISLGSSAPSLRFGQQVDADIRTAWNPNALKVPYSAIINKKGASYVIVIDEGRAKYVQVETGIEDFSHVEILQGVNIGQSVVLANGQDIDNGQKVFLAANSR